MSRALRELERDLAATRQTRAAVAAGDVVDMEDPDVHATDDAWLNRPTLFDDLHTGTDIMTNYTVYEAFNPFMKVVHDLQNAGEAAQTLLSRGRLRIVPRVVAG